MRKVSCLMAVVLLVCLGCEWHLKTNDEASDEVRVSIDRYDRIESLYLTTGDYAALVQMNKSYPMQTRTLIEDVLEIGQVNEEDINTKFLQFFRDSTLQVLICDVEDRFADMEDLSYELTEAFKRLKEEIPHLEVPEVYAQIGSFDQSIIVGNNMVGISLDKYLGADYPFYQEHFSQKQRQMMTRSMIVPDCIGFYLLSLYPLPSQEVSNEERDLHMGKIQWVVNQVTGKETFDNSKVMAVERYMKSHKDVSMEQLLRSY